MSFFPNFDKHRIKSLNINAWYDSQTFIFYCNNFGKLWRELLLISSIYSYLNPIFDNKNYPRKTITLSVLQAVYEKSVSLRSVNERVFSITSIIYICAFIKIYDVA